MPDPVSILIVGQTPPPFNGQAVMIQKLLEGSYQSIVLDHVRMDFSDESDQIGKLRWEKIPRLIRIIAAIVAAQFRKRSDVLYYPPCGPNFVPFVRDCLILIAVRRLFARTVFHFHATGLSEIYPRLPLPLKWLFRLAYGRPDLCIGMTDLGPQDAAFLQAREIAIIPYGIDDVAGSFSARPKKPAPVILFVGLVCEEKGVDVLLEAASLLQKAGACFRLEIVGQFNSKQTEQRLLGFVRDRGLAEIVSFPGVLTGDAKWEAYRGADVFCFPSHYPPESFPVVLLEASQFGLPIVSTCWKGIPAIVSDGESGLLVPTRRPDLVAEKLRLLLEDAAQREALGRRARSRYEADFHLEVFRQRMEAALFSLSRP